MSSNKCSCCAVGKPFGFLVGFISALRQYRTLGCFAVGKLLIGRAVATVKLVVENHTLLDGYTGGELDKHFFCMSKDHCRLNSLQFPYDHGKYKTLTKYFCSAGEIILAPVSWSHRIKSTTNDKAFHGHSFLWERGAPVGVDSFQYFWHAQDPF